MDLIVIPKHKTTGQWKNGFNCHLCQIHFPAYLDMETHYLQTHQNVILYLVDQNNHDENVIKRPFITSETESVINDVQINEGTNTLSVADEEVVEDHNAYSLSEIDQESGQEVGVGSSSDPDWDLIFQYITNSGFAFDEKNLDEIAAELANNIDFDDDELMEIHPEPLMENN